MPPQQHYLTRLSLDVELPDMESALRLRARAEDLSQRALPAIVERVFEALDTADLRIEIGRIEVDLGTIAASRLEEDAPAALERALADALADAVAAARMAPGQDARAVPLAAAALEDFDTYLVHGTRRFDGAESFDPAAALRHLLATGPDALVTTLRRRARDRHALERMVLQLDETDLRALLAVLAPADAALILGYHAELRRLRPAPIALAEPALRHATWLLTLDYLLREPGTQFNRRAFVAHLLRGIAAEQGIDYSTLLALIRDALGQTRRRRPLAGSLPAVLDTLIAEQVPDGAPQEEPQASTYAGADTLLKRFRDAANGPAALEALVRRLTAPRFAKLIEQIEPVHAALILAYVAGLTALHREAPLVALSQGGFERQLRLIVLRYLLREAGSQFNRRSWLRRLLRRLAAVGGVSYAFLLESLGAALAVLRRRLPPQGSLPAAVAQLMLDLPASAAPAASDADTIDTLIARLHRHHADDAALTALIDGTTDTTFRVLVETLEPRHAAHLLDSIADLAALQRGHLLVALSASAFETHLRLIAIRWLLRDPRPAFRAAAWFAWLSDALAHAAGVDPVRLAARIAGARSGAVTDDLSDDPATLLRAAAAMSEAGLAAALAGFDAPGAEAAADLALLVRRHAEAPLADLDAAAFRALIAALAISELAKGGRFHRADLRRRLLAGIARHQGLPARELGSWLHLEREPGPADRFAPDPLPLVERFLRTGGPPAVAARMAQAAVQDPAGFAALLGRLTTADSGEAGRLIERLLAWMLPEEVAAALLPGDADRAAAWAARLADMPGGGMTAAWTRVLDTALRGGALDTADPPPPGERHDALALLRHWLAHGTLAWWAPPDTRVEPLLARLAGLPMPELHALLGGADADAVAVRLRRAAGGLGAAGGKALIETLAPWAFAPAGPFATLAAGLSGEALGDARIRAAAAAIAGTPIDWQRLARRLPPETSREPERVPPPAEADRAALFGWLSGTGPATPPRLAAWLRLLAQLADRGDPGLDAALRGALPRREAQARWAAAMPDEIFARVIHRLAPARARFLLDTAAIIAAARRRATPGAAHGETAEALRGALLAMLAESDAPAPRAVVGRLIAALPGITPDTAERTRMQAADLARRGGHANTLAAFNPPRIAQPPPAAAPREQAPDKPRPPEPQAGDTIYVANAGLVLFNPFLPRFFERIGVLTPDAQGVPHVMGIEAASRAVHLLQYLIDERCDAPEQDLALNKLLSGVPIAAPIARTIDPSDEDRALCAELINAVIANWPIIKKTSPAGLRETFLQREGRLRREADRWTLDIERKTLDVLVDQVPWNRALVYHRWMGEAVHVNW